MLCCWLAKPQLVKHLEALIEPERGVMQRSAVPCTTLQSRSLEDIFNDAHALSPRFACLLCLMATFGFETKRAWVVRPWHLTITDDTRTLIEWARTFAATASSSMIPPTDGLKGWHRKFYRYCRSARLSRAHGITPRSLHPAIQGDADLSRRLALITECHAMRKNRVF
jgi:hypothetical protein